ncbi:transcriptional regulator TbsP [Halobaculum sp. MBLA0147]|uniref:transcriptional regulator TbsP n=1 Tax=Halobaculum sp. MBLA0147 TaxID=3079934 RepID=UPI003526B170
MSEYDHVGDRSAVVASVLGDAEGPVLIVDPDVRLLETVVAHAVTTEVGAQIRLLATETVLKAVRDDFPVAADTADLVEDGTLEVRTLSEATSNTLFVTDDDVFAVVGTATDAAALTAEDDEFVADVNETYGEQFETAEPFDLRTPGRTRMLETLTEELGEAAADDFAAVLGEPGHSPSGDPVDGVALSLLVAARHEAQLYTVSHWGEDVGLASRATFSREKTELEDDGILTTEKVPTDVGRPRLRLLLADEELAAADDETFVELVTELLT